MTEWLFLNKSNAGEVMISRFVCSTKQIVIEKQFAQNNKFKTDFDFLNNSDDVFFYS